MGVSFGTARAERSEQGTMLKPAGMCNHAVLTGRRQQHLSFTRLRRGDGRLRPMHRPRHVQSATMKPKTI
eukprot:365840-Chlamydomonas_euryale.AAC.9